MAFRKVKRSYHTPDGWRLATFEEVRNELETIKILLEKWDRVRLLDGWITGPGYDFQMGNDFKGCLGYMLLIEPANGSGGVYDDVHLSDRGKEVALFLCVDDWNYQLLYFLLNSFSHSHTMNIPDVIGGNLPFTNSVTEHEFLKMNKMISNVAIKLGNEVGAALDKARKTEYSGIDSIKKVMSGMIKIVTEDMEIVQFIGYGMWPIFRWYEGEEYCVSESVFAQDDTESFWSFVCDSFAGYVVEVGAYSRLKVIVEMKTRKSSRENFMTATSILLYLSDFRSDIIHEPLAHQCLGSCAEKILRYAQKKALSVPRSLSSILQHNAMWRCYDDSGNYDVLSKLLFIVAKGRYAKQLEQVKGITATIINILMKCGAQPAKCFAIGKYKRKTALHSVAKFRYEEVGIEVAKALLSRNDGQSISEFVNAQDDEGGTALHCASRVGNAGICRLLLDCSASPIVQDEFGMTALHYAVVGGIGDVIDVLLTSPEATESLDLKSKQGKTALDIAVSQLDHQSTAKLLPKFNVPPEAYFDKVDKKKLLRYSLLFGSVDIVTKLLERGTRLSADECDEDGKTVLHLAAMCDDETKAITIISHITGGLTLENIRKMVAKKDKRLRTVLHEAALKGHVRICEHLLKSNPELRLLADECDEDGKTILHLVAMCNDETNAFDIISHHITLENIRNMVAKEDKGLRTVLHEAAFKGHVQICKQLLEVNPDLIYMRDRDGQNPLYDAVKGKSERAIDVYRTLVDAYLVKDNLAEDELTARNGLTLLHVAASQQGKDKLVKEILSSDKSKRKYLSKGDIHAQTALHKAVKCGDVNTVEILLRKGADPLRERDCDGQTALHYVVQAESKDKKKVEMARLLFRGCQREEEKALLLWSSAAGLGTAEDLSKESGHQADKLHKFLVAQKESYKKGNLLRFAATFGDIEMTKEMISRGYQIGDIRDPNWKKTLTPAKRENVEIVLRQIKMIKEQGNDKPAVSDTLGRVDYAQGLAALFLNPYIKPPIAVGITGSWGMGKSSLMLQTQRILLTTAAQMALFPSSKSLSSELPDMKACQLSRNGERKLRRIYRYIKSGEGANRNIFVTLWYYIRSKLQKTSLIIIQEELEKFLNEYDVQNLKLFKALAAMDSSDMWKTKTSWQKVDPPAEENVPAVLIVQYNAWKYRNDTEALAGIAVEITKEMEGVMTQAQWLNTCWRNTWRKKKYTIWIEIFFPSLLSLVLVGSFTWITWVVSGSHKFQEWGKAKYAWPPAALVIIVWTLTRAVMGILKPVSTQLMQYISFPDHTDKLGYHERVISDISFLKDEIGKKAYWLFILFSWVITIFQVLWDLITDFFIISNPVHHRNEEKAMVAPASGSNLRIIVFVDDLDRCQETVILQVLSAVNLVLAVCEISVVMGMDKGLIKRAIIKKYKDVKANESLKDKQELADMYLQKIIQLPLDLPEPSNEESRRFLKGQLGVLENESVKYPQDYNDKAVEAFRQFFKETRQPLANLIPDDRRSSVDEDDRSSSDDEEEMEAVQQNPAVQVEINVPGPLNIAEQSGHIETRRQAPSKGNEYAPTVIISRKQRQNLKSPPILIREILFVRYSKGEEEAFLYFQGLATDCRTLPREWKRLLNYHRLVWYIFSVSKEAKKLAGWQVQLITWIFVCWEWQDNMNLIIEKWKESGKNFLTSEWNEPSLLMIVEKFIKEHEQQTTTMTATSKGEDEAKWTQKLGASAAETETNKEGTETNTEETETNKEESETNKEGTETNKGESETNKEESESLMGKDKSGEESRDGIRKYIESMERATSQKLSSVEKKLDALEKSMAELKTEMNHLKEVVCDDLKKELVNLQKHVFDDIKAGQEQLMTEMRNRRQEQKLNEKNTSLLEKWKKMKSTLDTYDVSMDGIQAFQRFRFYCVAGHLPRPSLRR